MYQEVRSPGLLVQVVNAPWQLAVVCATRHARALFAVFRTAILHASSCLGVVLGEAAWERQDDAVGHGVDHRVYNRGGHGGDHGVGHRVDHRVGHRVGHRVDHRVSATAAAKEPGSDARDQEAWPQSQEPLWVGDHGGADEDFAHDDDDAGDDDWDGAVAAAIDETLWAALPGRKNPCCDYVLQLLGARHGQFLVARGARALALDGAGKPLDPTRYTPYRLLLCSEPCLTDGIHEVVRRVAAQLHTAQQCRARHILLPASYGTRTCPPAQVARIYRTLLHGRFAADFDHVMFYRDRRCCQATLSEFRHILDFRARAHGGHAV